MSEITLVDNPHENFSEMEQHIGQFHAHTDIGKHDMEPGEFINHYIEEGYTIICLGPKDYSVQPWPWTEISKQHDDWEIDVDPEQEGVIAVQGTEMDSPEHLFAFFTDIMIDDYGDTQRHLAARSIFEYDSKAIASLAHPGRYTDSGTNSDWGEDEWKQYVIHFRDLPRFFGLEVTNRGLGYDDRKLWDDLLTHFSYRRVVGYGVDDSSTANEGNFDTGRTVFTLDPDVFDPSDQQSTREAIRDAWLDGNLYFSTRDDYDDAGDHIMLEDVEHNESANEITVTPDGEYDRVEWIADGQVVGEQETFNYVDNTMQINNYVRCQFERDGSDGPEAICCTQAFRFGPYEVARQEVN